MRNYFTHLYHDMNGQIEEFKRIEPTYYTFKIINHIESVLEKLRQFIDDHPFETNEDEIHYFKYLKPKIISKLVYYKKIAQIEMEKPLGSIEDKKDQLKIELGRISQYYKAHSFFILYMRTEKIEFDENFFIRKKAKQMLLKECYSSEFNFQYGTVFDFRIGVMYAHELLEKYIQAELVSLDNTNEVTSKIKNTHYENQNMQWTDTQSSLSELVYALHASKVFNNGQADIKDITKCLEIAFNTNITNVYRTFTDIKKRKGKEFKFLESMLMNADKSIHEN